MKTNSSTGSGNLVPDRDAQKAGIRTNKQLPPGCLDAAGLDR